MPGGGARYRWCSVMAERCIVSVMRVLCGVPPPPPLKVIAKIIERKLGGWCCSVPDRPAAAAERSAADQRQKCYVSTELRVLIRRHVYTSTAAANTVHSRTERFRQDRDGRLMHGETQTHENTFRSHSLDNINESTLLTACLPANIETTAVWVRFISRRVSWDSQHVSRPQHTGRQRVSRTVAVES